MALLLAPATAKNLISIVPSTYITSAVTGFATRTTARCKQLDDDGITSSRSAERAALEGLDRGLKLSFPLGIAGLMLPRSTRGVALPTMLGHAINAQNGAWAAISHYATPYIDKEVVGKLLDRAQARQSGAEQALALGVKVAALYFLEVPRLLATALHLSVALLCGTIGAVLGLVYFGVKQLGGTPARAADETVSGAEQAAASVREATT